MLKYKNETIGIGVADLTEVNEKIDDINDSLVDIKDDLGELESEIEHLSDDDEYVLAQIEYIQDTDGAGFTSPVSPKGNYLSISNCKGVLGGSITSPQYSSYGFSLVNAGNMWRVRVDTGSQTVTPMINTPNVKIRLLVYIKKSELI